MRYLAIDLGDARTGLALGDDATGLVTPLTTVEVPIERNGGDDLVRAIAAAADEHLDERDELVVGLPLNMDGTEGPRARIVRTFCGPLGARTGRVIRFQDERLSSAQADWSMARSGLTHGRKKARRDALAAASILRDFLARRRQDPPDPPDATPGGASDAP